MKSTPSNPGEQESSRRSFLNKLAIGTVGGLVAGTTACSSDSDDPGDDSAGGGADDGESKEVAIILDGPNTCRGLNTCKDKGKGDHDCAGLGECATAEAHTCKGDNVCKGQGGCGSTAGQNECKGQGECAVPLSDKAWKSARSAFEKAAKDAGMKVGAAPAKA